MSKPQTIREAVTYLYGALDIARQPRSWVAGALALIETESERQAARLAEAEGRCATCRWWGIPADRDDDDIYHYEGAIPAGWRMCLRTEYNDLQEPPAGVRLAVAGYEFDGLATAPDFGCVDYEAATAPAPRPDRDERR